MVPETPEAEGRPSTPDESILPVGYMGMVAPMNSLGFAPHPGLGLIYDEVVLLLPAETLVFTFQQRRAAEEARHLPYDEAARRSGVRVFRLDDMERVELVRPFTGYRLVLEFREQGPQRWILQKQDIDELRDCFRRLLGDRFVDQT